MLAQVGKKWGESSKQRSCHAKTEATGELVAEYAANAAATTPLKEYGYRNGQLLVVAQETVSKDTVWIEDALPSGAQTSSDGINEAWNWITSSPSPFSGSSSDQTPITTGLHQQYFQNATQTFAVSSGDVLVASVYLDPSNMPTEVMLQFNDGSWEHRAFWGADNIAWGTSGTISRQYLGNLPAGGGWVRLEVPAAAVGLEGHTLNGFAFTLYGGRASLDRVGKTPVSATQWLVSDHLGTPRMIADQSGSLGGIRRHDYLPFGEELGAGTGGRTAAQGYSASDGVRQQFTRKERDIETGLDFFEARYYASMQGRFTSIDPYNIVMETQNSTDKKEAQKQFVTYLSDPRRWNRYVYCLNNPLLYTDPNGEDVTIYYRPPREGDWKDFGHFFIYVRNDETGESAYFDYYVDKGFTMLGQVDENRLSKHASLTIETSADQEQAILGGIKEMQQSAPNYDLRPNDRNGISECTNNAANLLKRGGIDPGFINKFLPIDAWNTLFRQYAPDQIQKTREYTGNERGRQWIDKEIIPGKAGESYGRDPRGQARRVDPNAINNRELHFRDGKRVN